MNSTLAGRQNRSASRDTNQERAAHREGSPEGDEDLRRQIGDRDGTNSHDGAVRPALRSTRVSGSGTLVCVRQPRSETRFWSAEVRLGSSTCTASSIKCYNHRVKNPHAVALGRLGGLRGGRTGGRARAAALTPVRRRQIARDAARARWRLPVALAPLFPGYAFEDIVLPAQTDLVMLHVLTRGGLEHRRWLVRRFGAQRIRNWIINRKGRGLTVAQMAPWVPARVARAWQAADPYAELWENR